MTRIGLFNQLEPHSDEGAALFLALDDDGAWLAVYKTAPKESEAREAMPKPRLFRSKLKGLRLYAANRVHVSILGKKFGDEMRAWKARTSSQADDPHRTVRPHIRRAHWHTYLYGPRSAEERERKVLWIPPVFVHSTKPEEQPI